MNISAAGTISMNNKYRARRVPQSLVITDADRRRYALECVTSIRAPWYQQVIELETLWLDSI
jgi:hypothetical protein